MIVNIMLCHLQDWSPEYSPDGVCHLNELPLQQIYSNDQGIWEM